MPTNVEIYLAVSCLGQQGPAENRRSGAAWLIVSEQGHWVESTPLSSQSANKAYYDSLECLAKSITSGLPALSKIRLHILDKSLASRLGDVGTGAYVEPSVHEFRRLLKHYEIQVFQMDRAGTERGIVSAEAKVVAITRRSDRKVLKGPEIRHIFVDESCQSGKQWMAFGSITLKRSFIKTAEEMLVDIRARHKYKREYKWKKMSDARLAACKSIVSAVLSQPEELKFACTVFDMSKENHAKYNEGDSEIGFYKFMYQHLLHQSVKYMNPLDRCIVHPDKRRSKYRLSDLRDYLNRGVASYRGMKSFNGVRAVEPVDSADSAVCQMTDIFLGAISATWNNSINAPGASQAKRELAEFIASEAQVTLSAPSSADNFRIWKFRMREN